MENVFEFLGLPADHRKPDKVVQKVKHFDEVPDSKKSWPMLGQIKKDGVYCLVVKRHDGKVGCFSRTGKRFTNVKHLESDFSASYAPPGVYIAELCNNSCSLEVLSGLVNPNRLKHLTLPQVKLRDNMYLSFHDFLTLEGFIEGYVSFGHIDRYLRLKDMLPFEFDILKVYWLEGEEDMDSFFNEAVKDKEEGIVIKQPEEVWVAGHKGYKMMKKVRGVSYDLQCIGAEEGKGKMKGKIGNLFFAWKDGKAIKCPLGKGWTHEDAQDMWDRAVKECHFGYPYGEIFEVYALQESSKGVLRNPKVGELRHDKTKADV